MVSLKETIDKIESQIGMDDSIIVDGSSLLTEGSSEFFSDFLSVLPRLKDKTLIIPIEGINAVNDALESKDERLKKLADDAISKWLNKATEYSQKKDSNLIFVGESVGAFSEKTVLNQVSFLSSDHNVLLITQDQKLTIEARNLRQKLDLKKHKLHCCKIMPDGHLGLYRISSED